MRHELTEMKETGIRHNCGIFAIFLADGDTVGITATALVAMNHRGHEGAGLAVYTPQGDIKIHKGAGYARNVFNEKILAKYRRLGSSIVIGQDRYSTSGDERAWQPFELKKTPGAVIHNGNITNVIYLLDLLLQGERNDIQSDTDIIARLIDCNKEQSIEEKIKNVFEQVEGAGNFIITAENKIFAYKDPWEFRPLSLAQLVRNDVIIGYCVASETCAYSSINGFPGSEVSARFFREIGRGECIQIDKDGLKTIFNDKRKKIITPAKCFFEQIYLCAPDSFVFGENISEVRGRIGAFLADQDYENGFLPEVIIPVQHSGIPYAESYGARYIKNVAKFPERFGVTQEKLPEVLSTLQTRTGLVVNQYAGGRAFISPRDRFTANILKHRANCAIVENKVVVLADDSIVRADASGAAVSMLRQAGAREVHVRIGCPPISHSCFMGVDTPRLEELVWNQVDGVDGVRRKIKADSLTYISPMQLLKILSGEEIIDSQDIAEMYKKRGYCGACILGKYPLDVSGVFSKNRC